MLFLLVINCHKIVEILPRPSRKKYFNSVEDLKENLKDVARLKHEAELSRTNIETCLKIQNDKFNEKLQQMQCFPIILEQKKLELDKSTEKLKITESALHSLAVDFESVLQRCDKATWELEEQNMLTSQLLVDKELLKVEGKLSSPNRRRVLHLDFV